VLMSKIKNKYEKKIHFDAFSSEKLFWKAPCTTILDTWGESIPLCGGYCLLISMLHFLVSPFFLNWNRPFLLISNILGFFLLLFLWKSLGGFYARFFFNLCLGLGYLTFFSFGHLR
jgi:hypothetical protein